MKRLPIKTRRIFDFIKFHQDTFVIVPSLREISNHFGWRSTMAAKYHVDLLLKEKMLEKVPPTMFRGYKINTKHKKYKIIPSNR